LADYWTAAHRNRAEHSDETDRGRATPPGKLKVKTGPPLLDIVI